MYQKIDKMVKDLEKRGQSKNTIKIMEYTIKSFSKFYNQPPELLGELTSSQGDVLFGTNAKRKRPLKILFIKKQIKLKNI